MSKYATLLDAYLHHYFNFAICSSSYQSSCDNFISVAVAAFFIRSSLSDPIMGRVPNCINHATAVCSTLALCFAPISAKANRNISALGSNPFNILPSARGAQANGLLKRCLIKSIRPSSRAEIFNRFSSTWFVTIGTDR